MDPYAAGWLAVGAAGIALELTAVATGHRDKTLSAYIRRALGLYPRQSWATLGVVGLAAALTWLGVHLAFGIWP